ncbi:MAG: hypothetical protein R2856_01705 [Caldilineaceae bacterium]
MPAQQPSPLLTTKFYIPPARAAWVARPRLLRRLDRAVQLGHRLALVAAPAGYGKTTLAAAWIAARKTDAPIAWLSVDNADNDPQRFFAYALAALRRSGLEISRRAEDRLQQGKPRRKKWASA